MFNLGHFFFQHTFFVDFSLFNIHTELIDGYINNIVANSIRPCGHRR